MNIIIDGPAENLAIIMFLTLRCLSKGALFKDGKLFDIKRSNNKFHKRRYKRHIYIIKSVDIENRTITMEKMFPYL